MLPHRKEETALQVVELRVRYLVRALPISTILAGKMAQKISGLQV